MIVVNLEQLIQLVEIERQGTISSAAERLHMTQPSLSRSMQRLEAELGQELFDRARNRARINDAGRIVAEHAREMLASEQRMRDALDELAKRRRTLRVGSVAPAPVWNLTARIVERFPGTILETDLLDEGEVEKRLFGRTIDLAVTRRPIALPTCACTPLMTESLSLFAPLTSRFAKLSSVGFSDIDGEAFLVFEDIGFWRDIHQRSMPHATIINQKDREVFFQLLRSSDLLAFTTDAVQGTTALPDRVAIPIRDASAHATFYLVTLRDASERIREIATAVREES